MNEKSVEINKSEGQGAEMGCWDWSLEDSA